jgi:hypothetical protein
MESDEHEVLAGTGEVPRQRTGRTAGTGPTAGHGAAAAWQLLGIVRTLRARERDHLAAVLHDGPIQELAAATLELSLAGRATAGGDELAVPARQVEAAGRSLRRLVDALAPLPQHERGATGLAAALDRRTRWLLAGPLAVDLGEGAAGLRAAEIEAVADLVELMLLGAAGAQAPGRALAAVRADGELIVVELRVSATGDPADARAWLDRLAAAMRIGADIDLQGYRVRARMEVPRPPAA